jgi:xanthine/uracil permease
LNTINDIIGLASGILVVISAFPYSWRVWERKITPNITGWSLWAVVGLALLLTYHGSGARANVWPAVFGFTNPLLITILAIIKRGERTKLKSLEWACVAFCFISLVAFLLVRGNQVLVQYALYIAIVADGCAALPTIDFVYKHPMNDRPGAWAMFAVAFSLALFAITEHTVANYSLPIYMFIVCCVIIFPLVRVRIKNRTPLKEWI